MHPCSMCIFRDAVWFYVKMGEHPKSNAQPCGHKPQQCLSKPARPSAAQRKENQIPNAKQWSVQSTDQEAGPVDASCNAFPLASFANLLREASKSFQTSFRETTFLLCQL